MSIDTIVIENHIKLFVQTKIDEDVYLDLKRQCISIVPLSKKGSTTLATFWAKVLQNKNVFPATKYLYHKDFDRKTEQSILFVKAAGVTFTIFMKTGTLTIEGEYVYDWFKNRIRDVLTAYDESVGFPVEGYGQVVQADEDEAIPVDEPRLVLKEKSAVVNSTITAPVDMAESMDQLESVLGRIHLDLLSTESLQMRLKDLPTGCIREGHTYVYELWKSLLHKWFSEGFKVYIATPVIDTQRVLDIVDFMFQNKETADLEGLFVQYQCGENKRISDVKREVLELPLFSPPQRLHIEYKLFNKLNYPAKTFNCKFIAGVKGDAAQVMVTSAGFNRNHFEEESYEFVMFHQTKKDNFIREYMEPLTTSIGLE
ncbi:uncharacterized protein LOC106167160 [Lingula anatina]|uniref:Uncharacterized protein LOC106167160 n=1 Tax=Lingula anatina TaxID=7574 RepID=A0A1S3ISZ5_LINAN|nr:uncharacterized protein LOC106167160 [Lingula anatina]|eukprot:XP_013401322.1 uncharacterized protein LOC106167160 [Lingula anatina]